MKVGALSQRLKNFEVLLNHSLWSKHIRYVVVKVVELSQRQNGQHFCQLVTGVPNGDGKVQSPKRNMREKRAKKGSVAAAQASKNEDERRKATGAHETRKGKNTVRTVDTKRLSWDPTLPPPETEKLQQ